jgi:hypothetical protein
MAKKVGKFMAEFKGTANEFKDTWRREVDLENVAKEFDLSNLESQVAAEKPVQRTIDPPVAEIKPVDAETLERLKAAAAAAPAQIESTPSATVVANDKKNWL